MIGFIVSYLLKLSEYNTYRVLIHRVFIKFMGDSSIEVWKGYAIAVLFFIVLIIQSICYQFHLHYVIKVSIRMRAALIDTLYRKTLTVAPSATANYSGTGDFLNFLAIDLQRLQDMLQFVYFFWFTPVNTVITIVLLWFQIGWIAFIGFGMLVGCITLNFMIVSGIRIIMVLIVS